MDEASVNNIHMLERILRLITGIGLIGSVFFIPAPFDYLIVLPLVGIYPCLTGIMGWDPVYYLADADATYLEFSFEPGLKPDTGVSYLVARFA